MVELSERGESLLLAGWRFAGKPEANGFARPEQDLFLELYEDDPDGGPELSKMYRELKAEFSALIPIAERFGIYFTLEHKKGLALKLTPDPRVPALMQIAQGMQQPLPPMPCPICSRFIAAPTIEQTMHRCGLQPAQRKWIRAINCLGGATVCNDMVLTSRFRDDPAPPAPKKQARELYEAVSEINSVLQERRAGFAIENQGYRQGYKIIYGVNR